MINMPFPQVTRATCAHVPAGPPAISENDLRDLTLSQPKQSPQLFVPGAPWVASATDQAAFCRVPTQAALSSPCPSYVSRRELATPPRFYALSMAALVEKLRVKGCHLSSEQLKEIIRHHTALVDLDRRHAHQASSNTVVALSLRREVRDRVARMNDMLQKGSSGGVCLTQETLVEPSPLLSELTALIGQADGLEHDLSRLPDANFGAITELFSIWLCLLALRRDIFDEKRHSATESVSSQSFKQALYGAPKSASERQEVVNQARRRLYVLAASLPQTTPTLEDLLSVCQTMLKKAKSIGHLDEKKSNQGLENFLSVMKTVTEELRRLNDNIEAGDALLPDTDHRIAMWSRLAQEQQKLNGLTLDDS